MPDISLTDFVDFALAPGPTRLTKVRQLKARGDYDPAHDYWRQLREGIAAYNEGDLTAKGLENIARIAAPHKRANYEAALKGFKKFDKKAPTETQLPLRTRRWIAGDLSVRVNPELSYAVDGTKLCIKLYFKKSPPLTKDRMEAILLLMQQTIKAYRPALLDVQTGRLIEANGFRKDLDILLRAEALAFCEMWKNLP
jgi:hypothetical protein